MAANKTLDTIVLRNLHTTCCIGPDAWARPGKQQPVILTLRLQLDTRTAGASDDIGNTLSYGTVCKDVLSRIEGAEFASITSLASEIAQVARSWQWEGLGIQILAPKALLRVEGGLWAEVSLAKPERGKEGFSVKSSEWAVRGLKAACVIGVNPHERLEKQTVVIDLEFAGVGELEGMGEPYDFGDGKLVRGTVRGVCEAVEKSSFETLEALAALIARSVLVDQGVERVKVAVEKPSALAAVEGAGVEIVRDWEWLLHESGKT